MNSCDIIRDLLPLYADNVASDGSRALVDEHIKSCKDCREMLARLQEGEVTIPVQVDKAEISTLKTMKRKLFFKTFTIACAAIAATILLIFGAFGYYTPLPYAAEKMSVIAASDGTIDILYDGNYTGATGLQWGDEFFVGFDGTLFTRLFPGSEKAQYRIGSTFSAVFDAHGQPLSLSAAFDAQGKPLSAPEAINTIYYMDYRKLPKSQAETEQAKPDAILIWQRD